MLHTAGALPIRIIARDCFLILAMHLNQLQPEAQDQIRVPFFGPKIVRHPYKKRTLKGTLV